MAALERDIGPGDGADLAPNVEEESRINSLQVQVAEASQMSPEKPHLTIEMESIVGSSAVINQEQSTVIADTISDLGPSTDGVADAESGSYEQPDKSHRVVTIPPENRGERPLIVIIPRGGGPARVIDPDAGGGLGPIRRRDADGDEEIFEDVTRMFEDRSVRRAFISKVFLILTLQLAFSIAVISFLIYDPEANLYVRQNIGVYWAAVVIFFATYIPLVCCDSLRRSSPCNVIMLVLVTLSQSYLAGVMSAFHETYLVFGAMLITATVTMSIYILAVICPVDLTARMGSIIIISIVGSVIMLVTFIVHLVAGTIKWTLVLISAICALLLSLYLMWDIQLIMGGRKYSLSPDEVILAVLLLYVDIMLIFEHILSLLGLTSN